MKVLLCISCLMTGGTEIQTLNLVHALVEGGHEVWTLCYFEYCGEMVERYRNAGSKVILLSPGGSRVGGWRDVLLLFKGLRKALRQIHPDVAHVQYMAPGAIPIVILRLLGCRCVITTTHTAADIYPSLRLVHFIQRHCVRAFTCITETAERSFFGTSRLYSEDFVLKKRNHLTIYNALPKSFVIAQTPREFGRPIVLGVVSRLEHIKGMDMVIPVYAEILKEFPDTKLIVVGEGFLRQSMEQQAVALHCNSSITWAGRQPQEHIQEWYSRIDVLLMPSRSEGFGLTAIEAMASGCVVVASDIGGLPEVVRDDEVGLLHTLESVSDIVEKVKKLIANPGLMERLSANAVKYVGQYSLDRYTQLFNDLYSKLSR